MPPNTSKTIPLLKGDKRLIKVGVVYNNYRHTNDDPIIDDWSNVDPGDFNNFRMRIYDIYVKSPIPDRFKQPDLNSSQNVSSQATQKLTKA